MNPKELYYLISSKMPECIVSSICCVEKNCVKMGFCPSKQNIEVLDFDEVKNKHYRLLRKVTPASVDALVVGGKGSSFCFVELKGWQNYLNNLTKQKKSAKETAEGYNLSGKLADSQNLCMELSGDSKLFDHMSVFFLLVTDVDPDGDGIGYLYSMLTALGETTTEIYSQCITEAQSVLDSEIHIDKAYIQCRHFDEFLQSI